MEKYPCHSCRILLSKRLIRIIHEMLPETGYFLQSPQQRPGNHFSLYLPVVILTRYCLSFFLMKIVSCAESIVIMQDDHDYI